MEEKILEEEKRTELFLKQLSGKDASRILDNVLSACRRPPCQIPYEVLEGSEEKRKERKDSMTGKAFSRLTRQELLRLLLTQGQEQKRLEEQIDGLTIQKRELEQSYERLKKRLDEKDEQIEHLKDRLNNKDKKIKKLEATSGLSNTIKAAPELEVKPAQVLVENKTEKEFNLDFDTKSDWSRTENINKNEFDWDIDIGSVQNRNTK